MAGNGEWERRGPGGRWQQRRGERNIMGTRREGGGEGVRVKGEGGGNWVSE